MAWITRRLVLRHGLFEHPSGPSTRPFSTTAARQVIRPPEPYNAIRPHQTTPHTPPISVQHAEAWVRNRLSLLHALANEDKSTVASWSEPNRWGLASPRKDEFFNMSRARFRTQAIQRAEEESRKRKEARSPRYRAYGLLESRRNHDNKRNTFSDVVDPQGDDNQQPFTAILPNDDQRLNPARPSHHRDLQSRHKNLQEIDVVTSAPPRLPSPVSASTHRGIPQNPDYYPSGRSGGRTTRASRTENEAERIRSITSRNRVWQAPHLPSAPSFRPFSTLSGTRRQYHSDSAAAGVPPRMAAPLGELLETIDIGEPGYPKRFDSSRFTQRALGPSPTHKLLARSLPPVRKFREPKEKSYKPISESWAPRKRLSLATMGELRKLYQADPVINNRPVLAKKFSISVEAVSRILHGGNNNWREKAVKRATDPEVGAEPMPARQARAAEERERDLSSTKWARPEYSSPLV